MNIDSYLLEVQLRARAFDCIPVYSSQFSCLVASPKLATIHPRSKEVPVYKCPQPTGRCTPVNESKATEPIRYSLFRIKLGPKITNSTTWPIQPSSLSLSATVQSRTTPLSFLGQIPLWPFLQGHHDLSLSYKKYYLLCRRRGDLYGEDIHPVLTSLIRCSESVNEKTPI